jgi:chromate reductase, NAD(P)H dehydrogenase (quinone)
MELAPEGMKIVHADIADIPLYNEDVRAAGFPAPVKSLREQVRAADALLLVTPEYNYSVPGVLKNVIDWVSRPPDQPFAGKPAAIMGASPGAMGTARAQYHLRQIFVYLDLRLLNRPKIMIGNAPERFDTEGRLAHEQTRELIKNLLLALKAHTLQLRNL